MTAAGVRRLSSQAYRGLTSSAYGGGVNVSPVPATGLLTGPEAGDILQTALDAAGGQLLSWRATQVDHQPRHGTTVGYRARVRWPDGREEQVRFGAYNGPPPPGALVIGDGTERVTVWRFPYDPYLPALPAAHDPAGVTALVRSFGLADGPVRLELRAYRPRRRAVVEVRGTSGSRLFLKVVRPSQVAGLHQRHRLLTDHAVPVPPSLGYTEDGLLVLQALGGQTLRDVLRTGGQPAPDAAEILALLDRLPAALVEVPARRSWLDRVGHYANVLSGVAPRQASLAAEVAAAVAAEAGRGPTVPVHGDFYESQLRVSGGRIVGLLDVDTAGPGDRIDDLACLLGHLSVLSQLTPDRATTLSRLGARYLAAFDRTVDAADLRYRVAAVVLSLATGPFRVQEAGWEQATGYRIALAARWLEQARALR